MNNKNAIYKYRNDIIKSYEEYFRDGGLPETLMMSDKRSSCSLNIPVGSTCDENPNVRHRSREELLRELVDQGYNINQYKL